MILAGIWFGPKKPSMPTFLAPFRSQMNNLKLHGKNFMHDSNSLIQDKICRKLIQYIGFILIFACMKCLNNILTSYIILLTVRCRLYWFFQSDIVLQGVSATCNGERFVCRAVCLIGTADLPGKSALQGFMQFNGKNGCSFCQCEGETVAVGRGHCRTYPYEPGPLSNLRTKESTFQYGQQAQQLGSAVSFII